jgi:hypothetical protein
LSALFIALAVGGGFLLGLRVGLGIGHRNAEKKRVRARSSAKEVKES